MIDLLKQLIEIPSVSKDEAALVAFFAGHLEKLFPNAISIDDRNITVDLGDKQAGTTLLLCSHIDTVSPASGWTKDPFKATVESTVEDDRIYGLGANDALASVVSMTEAAKRVAEKIKGRLLLSFVCEEELGGNGFYKIEPTLPRYTYGIFGEPTNMRIGHTMRGSMHLTMLSRGKSCHASRPHEGKNAVEKSMHDLEKIFSLKLKDSSPWGGATVQPTIIKGGASRNQIPDLVETILDVRPTSEINNEAILNMLRQAGIEFEIIANRRKPMTCPPDSPLLAAVKHALPDSPLYPFGGSCDMAYSTAPSLVIGPGASERSHAADEFICKSELDAAANGYERVILELIA